MIILLENNVGICQCFVRVMIFYYILGKCHGRLTGNDGGVSLLKTFKEISESIVKIALFGSPNVRVEKEGL